MTDDAPPPDDAQVADRLRLRSPQVYEVISLEGREELSRPILSLFASGTAAGIAMGASVVGYALLSRVGPEGPTTHAIASLGYTFGFLIVIMGRLQLFTENTITPILPALKEPSLHGVVCILRLWGTVFLANMVGTFAFALVTTKLGLLGPDVLEAVRDASLHMIHSEGNVFLRGIPAGFLVAAVVWMLPSSEGNEAIVVLVLTYLISLGSFTHVIAGSVEVFVLVLQGDLGVLEGLGHHLLPALGGNLLGGTGLFTLLAYAQVASELEENS